MKRPRTRHSAVAVAAVALLLAAAVAARPADADARPVLRLSPVTALPGDVVTVSGSGFASRATGFVVFGRARVAALRTNRFGRFVARFRTPAAVPVGRVVVTAIVRVGRRRIPGTKRYRHVKLQRVARPFTLAAPPPPPPTAVVVAMGDITSSATNKNAIAVRDVTRGQNPDRILMLGDYQYSYGSLSAILAGADKIWGPKPGGLFHLIKPTAGPTHDVTSCSESDYRSYWGVGAMQPYSFDVGTWHVISLPSAAYRYGCDTAGILAWLKQDLATHRNVCTLAFWHEPYWTRPTAEHTRDTSVKPWVQALYDAGADVILNGHQHDYQRFAPQNLQDAVDTSRGIREFVVGTGGIGQYALKGSTPNLEASSDTIYGALKLTLRPTGYDWTYLRAAGSDFSDSGSWSCH